MDFVDRLFVSEEERSKLRALGVRTPLAALALRKASQDAFDTHFGTVRAEMIAAQLRELLSESERQSLSRPVRPGGSLGARLEPPRDSNKPAKR
jgi:hypothetical protein